MNYLIMLEIQETQFHYLEARETTYRNEDHVIWAYTRQQAAAVAAKLADIMTDYDSAPDEPTVVTVSAVVPLQGAQA